MSKGHLTAIPFKFHEHELRVVIVDHLGNPWFVLRDACLALGLSNPTVSGRRLHPDDRRTISLANSAGRIRDTPIISEAGLYELILRSEKPQAREFQRWIVATVLPTIRRTGGYNLPQYDPIPATDAGRLMELTVSKAVEVLSKPGGALFNLMEEVKKLREEHNPAVQATAFMPMLEVLERLNVDAKGRRSMSRYMARRLNLWCKDGGWVVRSKMDGNGQKKTKTLMFHVDAIDLWLAETGRLLIDAYRAKLDKRPHQPSMPLKLRQMRFLGMDRPPSSMKLH